MELLLGKAFMLSPRVAGWAEVETGTKTALKSASSSHLTRGYRDPPQEDKCPYVLSPKVCIFILKF